MAGPMTPKERRLLAEALTAATGQRWRCGKMLDLCIDGAARDEGEPRSIVRVGLEGFLLVPSPKGWPYREEVKFGTFTGLGWLPRLVAAAVVAIAEYDARASVRVLSERQRRRLETYRRIVNPDSGACASERAQAQRHLDLAARKDGS